MSNSGRKKSSSKGSRELKYLRIEFNYEGIREQGRLEFSLKMKIMS